MAMKYKLTKAAYDALSDEAKAEYIVGETAGEYILDVTGLPEPEDTGPLQRALESERGKVKTLTTERNELKTKIAEFPDVEALKTQHNAEVGKYKTFTEKTLVENAALALASKISTSPALLLPHIKARLIADMTGDEPVTKVLGADGKASDLTIDKLGEEFVANKEFGSIMIASKASGSGTQPAKPNASNPSGGTPRNGSEPPADLSKLTGPELKAHIEAKKQAAAAQA